MLTHDQLLRSMKTPHIFLPRFNDEEQLRGAIGNGGIGADPLL